MEPEPRLKLPVSQEEQMAQLGQRLSEIKPPPRASARASIIFPEAPVLECKPDFAEIKRQLEAIEARISAVENELVTIRGFPSKVSAIVGPIRAHMEAMDVRLTRLVDVIIEDLARPWWRKLLG
jgi:hypothetical protein